MRRSVLYCWVGVAFGGGACAAPPRQPSDPTPGAFHFTVESYNLNNDMSGNADTLEALGRADAEVVCLQEITDGWIASIEARFASSYPFRLFKADPGGGAAGLGILSRFPVRDGGWHAGPNGWHPSWYYLVDTSHGTFQIMNTHLRNATGQHGGTVQSYLTTDADHRYEIELFVSRRAAPFPTLILGDFNEGPDGAAVKYLEGIDYQNVLPLYHPNQPTWRYERSLGGQFTQEIDHILFDGSFEPLNAWVVNAGASDHLPVVAHFEAATPW